MCLFVSQLFSSCRGTRSIGIETAIDLHPSMAHALKIIGTHDVNLSIDHNNAHGDHIFMAD
jgi:hypothetical protein